MELCTMWSFLCNMGLTSFTWHVLKIHPSCSMYQYIISFSCQIIFCYMDIPHFIYPFINWWTYDCFHFLAIMNNAVMDTFKFLCGYIFSFLLGIYLGVGLVDYIATLFNLLRNCQTVFQDSYTISYSHQQCMKFPISLHPLQPLVVFCL